VIAFSVIAFRQAKSKKKREIFVPSKSVRIAAVGNFDLMLVILY